MLGGYNILSDKMKWPNRRSSHYHSFTRARDVPKFKWPKVKGQPRPWDSYRGVRRNWARWLRWQDLMLKRQARGKRQYSITHRYLDGRWDVYSVEVDGWHILVKDNGTVVSVNYRTRETV